MRKIGTGLVLALGTLILSTSCSPEDPSGDKGDSSPAFFFGEDGSNGGYQKARAGFSLPDGLTKGKRHVFAAKPSASSSTGNAVVDLLREEGEVLTVARQGMIESVKPAPKEPARAVILDNVSGDSLGTLLVVDDLTESPTVRNVPEGSKVPAEGVWWGNNGNELLFVAQFSEQQGIGVGSLYWSDTSSSKVLGSKVSPGAVLVLHDANKVVFGHDLGANEVGKLSVADLDTGNVSELASSAKLVFGQGAIVFRHFSVSKNGNVLVYSDAEGKVHKKEIGSSGDFTYEQEGGSLPALSAGGEVVAFYADEQIFVARGSDAPLALGPARNDRAHPTLSDDGQWVFWCAEVDFKQFPTTGKGFIARTDGSGAPAQVGEDMACDVAHFLGDATLATLQKLKTFTTGKYTGFGELHLSTLGGSSAKLAEGVKVSTLWSTANHGLTFVENQKQGSNASGQLSTLALGADKSKAIQKDVQPENVLISPLRDRAAFLSDYKTSDGERVASLYATTTLGAEASAKKLSKSSGKVKAELFYSASIGRDSRVVAVSAPDGVVWSFPSP